MRADEYKQLNFLLPICSMPSDRPTQQCSCFMSSSLPQGDTQVILLLLQVLPSLCPPAPSAPSTKSCSPSLDQINFLRQNVRFSYSIRAVTQDCPLQLTQGLLPLANICLTLVQTTAIHCQLSNPKIYLKKIYLRFVSIR